MKQNYFKISIFTLIEVVVSLALLSVSLAGLLHLSISSQLKVARGLEKWHRTHMLIQAAEYLLLQEDETELALPDEFFPYEGYSINASNEDIEDDSLPEELTGLDNQLPLKTLYIELVRTSDQEVIDSLKIDRFSFEEEEGGNG